MLLQSYLNASRSLAKLSSLGDIRESRVNEHIVNSLLDITCDSDSTNDQIYITALATLAPSSQMVLVQGGKLPKSSEIAVAKVEDFEIGVYAVTMEEWQGVRNWAVENGFELSEGAGGGPKHPVTCVNWYDCVKWCNAKSVMEGLEPVYGVKGKEGYYSTGEFGSKGSENIAWYKGDGYRLPTEAEWEWAARGGQRSQGYTFAGSNNLNAVGWYNENSGGAAHAVGEKAANELGLFDMSGNVWEWCVNLNTSVRSARGGGWDFLAEACAVALRYDFYPAYRYNGIGFRLARSLGN